MILTETALSFLDLRLRSPPLSWGVLRQRAQNFHNVATYPWLLVPAAFVIIIVMAFKFVGDGMRDAAAPYRQQSTSHVPAAAFEVPPPVALRLAVVW